MCEPVSGSARLYQLFAPGLLLVTCAACSIPKVVDSQTVKKMLPGTMMSGDLGLACVSGAALGPLVGSLGKAPEPDQDVPRAWKSLVLTNTSAGMCADFSVWEAELARSRAMFELTAGGAPTSAHYVADLHEVEKRTHEVAANRYLAAWTALGEAWPGVGSGCPTLAAADEPLYLLGLSSGVLAVIHDRAAGGVVGVPTDIPRHVERASACLDDAKWWGLPSAMRAAVWASVPGAAPEGADPITMLAASAAVGDTQHVRLSRAFQVQTLSTLGDQALMREAIAAHAASLDPSAPGEGAADPAWALLDAYATRMILHESDKVWTTETGSRTPMGRLGAFPGVVAPAGDDPLDALLDSMLSADPPAPVEAP